MKNNFLFSFCLSFFIFMCLGNTSGWAAVKSVKIITSTLVEVKSVYYPSIPKLYVVIEDESQDTTIAKIPIPTSSSLKIKDSSAKNRLPIKTRPQLKTEILINGVSVKQLSSNDFVEIARGVFVAGVDHPRENDVTERLQVEDTLQVIVNGSVTSLPITVASRSKLSLENDDSLNLHVNLMDEDQAEGSKAVPILVFGKIDISDTGDQFWSLVDFEKCPLSSNPENLGEYNGTLIKGIGSPSINPDMFEFFDGILSLEEIQMLVDNVQAQMAEGTFNEVGTGIFNFYSGLLGLYGIPPFDLTEVIAGILESSGIPVPAKLDEFIAVYENYVYEIAFGFNEGYFNEENSLSEFFVNLTIAIVKDKLGDEDAIPNAFADLENFLVTKFQTQLAELEGRISPVNFSIYKFVEYPLGILKTIVDRSDPEKLYDFLLKIAESPTFADYSYLREPLDQEIYSQFFKIDNLEGASNPLDAVSIAEQDLPERFPGLYKYLLEHADNKEQVKTDLSRIIGISETLLNGAVTYSDMLNNFLVMFNHGSGYQGTEDIPSITAQMVIDFFMNIGVMETPPEDSALFARNFEASIVAVSAAKTFNNGLINFDSESKILGFYQDTPNDLLDIAVSFKDLAVESK